ncbi:hypothetical protein [Caulobacter sp. B11]|nr:hypothetical protein [Caulobacter sp. B11]
MARLTNTPTRLVHWWQRHPMVALLLGWTVIATTAVAGAAQLWPSLAA